MIVAGYGVEFYDIKDFLDKDAIIHDMSLIFEEDFVNEAKEEINCNIYSFDTRDAIGELMIYNHKLLQYTSFSHTTFIYIPVNMPWTDKVIKQSDIRHYIHQALSTCLKDEYKTTGSEGFKVVACMNEIWESED